LEFSIQCCLLLLGLGLTSFETSARPVEAELPPERAATDALFTNDVVLKLEIEISPAGLESLAKEPREYVPVTIREGNIVYTNVTAHLKGSIGSFRSLDDKPGWTIKLGDTARSPTFHGLKKFHLNNSVQDPSYLSEWVCTELFRSAGVPASRVAHALVELNGHKLGLYVLLEGMDREFLGRYFRNTKGNLYGESSFADVTQPLERMEGKGENTWSDLKALAAAAQERDPSKSKELLPQVLDLERFLSFVAMEVMLCHWDGYTFAAHNYRVYEHPESGKACFFPHDLDQMIMNPNVPIRPGARGVVARALFKLPETRAQYRQRFETLFTNCFVVPVLTRRIDDWLSKAGPILQAYDPELAGEVRAKAAGLKERIQRRAQMVQKLLQSPDPANEVLQVNVLDVDTKVLIPQFTITPGYAEGENGVSWDKTHFYRALRGSFYLDMAEARLPAVPGFLKFEAEGYAPVVALYNLSTNAEDANYRIELKKGQRLTGIVNFPDYLPARNAQVALLTDSGGPALSKTQFVSQAGLRLARVGVRGRFTFASDPEANSVVAAHEKGFAEVPIDDISPTNPITLQPWGRIEGRMVGGPNVATQCVAMVTAGLTIPRFTGGLYRGTLNLDPESYAAEVLPNTAFTIANIPPGERYLWRSVTLSTPTTSDAPELGFVGRRLVVKPGDTCHLVWGENECELHGRIALDVSPQKPAGLINAIDLNDLQPATRIGFIKLTPKEKPAALPEEYVFTLGPDESCVIPGLNPGEYRAALRAFAPPRLLGSAETNISISAGSAGSAAMPLNLGSIPFRPVKSASVGDAAPSFNLQTLDRARVNLADYRGKFVLVHFWASWCGQQVTLLPALRAVREAYAHNARLVMIGLNLDRSPEAAQRFAKRNSLDWPQAHLGEWFETSLPSEFGAAALPAVVLIGPDGKIRAANLSFSKLLPTLKAHLD
jgi:spore coat protein H